jgi:lipoprotein NlpD
MKYFRFSLLSVLVLSGCTSRQTPAPISNIGDQPKIYSVTTQGTIDSGRYTVKQGETLYSIAWRAGIDFRRLADMNGIEKPYEIFPGQVLELKTGLQASKNNVSEKQEVNQTQISSKNNKKTVANKKSGEYGKNQRDQKSIKKDPFPHKIRNWRYPSEGNIIKSYSAKENGNKGLDFGGKAGDPIIAASDGKVVYAGSALRGYGNLIIVKHNDDYLSAYAHNQSILVKEKDWVKAGQVIAEMGHSGTDTVKLHFEIRYRGRTVNPLKYLPKR